MNRMRAFVGAAAFAYAELAQGGELKQPFQIRLLTPIASYSPTGATFKARVVGPLLRDGSPVLPPGTIIHGSVRKAASVSLGLRRERAALDLDFHRCEFPDGRIIPCEAVLESVDNAREGVSQNNRIQGILAASHAHSWLGGVWYRPEAGLIHRSAVGLTGAGGAIFTRYGPGLAGAPVSIASRLLLFRMANPDIELPVGTELIIRLRTSVEDLEGRNEASQAEVSPELAEPLKTQPAEILQADRSLADDIVNLAFVGSLDQLVKAFTSAGWLTADPLTKRTFARAYSAYASMKAYPNAPVSRLFYRGRLPDLVFQKSFNSLAKRHHIRIWAAEIPGTSAWFAAATHDTGIRFNWSRMTVSHRIDPEIDRERSKVVNDLFYAGCASAIGSVQRPGLSRASPRRDRITTDGAASILLLNDCDEQQKDVPALARPRRPAIELLARRIILESRYYLTRGNAYYQAGRLVHWSFSARKARMALRSPGG